MAKPCKHIVNIGGVELTFNNSAEFKSFLANGGMDELSKGGHIKDYFGGEKPPISMSSSKIYVERPGVQLSHRGLQDVANEFSLPDVEVRERKSDLELRRDAEETINEWLGENEYSDKVEGLVRKAEGGEILTDKQRVILEQHLANVSDELRSIDKNSPEFDQKLEEIKRLKDAGQRTRSEAGAALRVPTGRSRPMDLSDYYIQEADSLGVSNLTEQQKEKVEKEYNEETEVVKALTERITKLQEENTRLEATKEITRQKSATPRKTKKTHEEYAKDRSASIEAAREALKKLRSGESGLSAVPLPGVRELIAIAPHVKDYVSSLVQEGVSNLQEIINKTHKEFKDIIPELTESDVNSIIAGKYNERRKTKNQITATLRDLRDEAALINKLDALLKGEDPKEERSKIKRNQQIETLKKEIKDFQKEKADAIREEKERGKQAEREEKQKEREANKKSPEEIALQTLKKRTQNEIDKLEEQLKNNDFDKEEKKNEPKLDKEATDLKDKLIKIRKDREVRLLQQEYDRRSKVKKAWDATANILNVPRSLMASLDFSAPLRQAALVTVSNPKLASESGFEMFRQAFSEKRFDRWFYDLQQTPRYQLMQESGLYVTDPHDPRLAVREEQFMSNLAEKIPFIGKLVKGSERAYISYLNKMRVDLFNRYADAFELDGITWENDPETYEGLAKFLNNSTGRGNLGPVEAAAPVLNGLFFSPRLIASRINSLNPAYYYNLPKPVRKEAIKNLAIFIGIGTITLALLSLGFGCEGEDDKDCVTVETDPRSSDFGKIRIDKTRWDIWGGFQQYIRLAAQMIMGQTKAVGSGKINELDGEDRFGKTRYDQLLSFTRGKLAPVPSYVVDQLAGRTVLGEKEGALEGATNRLVPLMLSDTYEAVKEDGIKAIFTQGIPATFGVGVQTYLPKGYQGKDLKDPSFKFLYDKGIKLPEPDKKKMTDDQFKEFVPQWNQIFKEQLDQAVEYGIMINAKGNTTIDVDDGVQIVEVKKATYDQLTGLMKSISGKATRDSKKLLGITDPEEQKKAESTQ